MIIRAIKNSNSQQSIESILQCNKERKDIYTRLSWDGSCCWWRCWTMKRTNPATEKEPRRSHIQLSNLLLATLRLLIFFPLRILHGSSHQILLTEIDFITLNPDSSRAQWIRADRGRRICKRVKNKWVSWLWSAFRFAAFEWYFFAVPKRNVNYFPDLI